MLGIEFDAVLDEARAGSSVALGAIYRDLFPSVLAYLRLRAPSEAEDLASEVFLGVATGLARFRGDESGFRAWVFTIARRRAIDAGRRRARRATDVVPAKVFESSRAVTTRPRKRPVGCTAPPRSSSCGASRQARPRSSCCAWSRV